MKKGNLLGFPMGSESRPPGEPFTEADYKKWSIPFEEDRSAAESKEATESRFRVLQMTMRGWREQKITQTGLIALDGIVDGHEDSEIHIVSPEDLSKIQEIKGIIILNEGDIDPFNLEDLKQRVEQGHLACECLLIFPRFSREDIPKFRVWLKEQTK